MGLSRKRQRELSRLKDHAEELWGEQKDVLEQATQIVREASRQAANYAREEVSPRVKETLDERVIPAVATGVSATKSAVSGAREKLADGLPSVSSALGSALAVLEVAKDPHVREVLKKVAVSSAEVRASAAKAGDKAVKAGTKAVKAGTKAGKKISAATGHKSAGPGRYILFVLAAVVVTGLAYAAWQTLRADDDLWVDEEELPEQESPKPVDDTV
jgi:hypothetical protein